MFGELDGLFAPELVPTTPIADVTLRPGRYLLDDGPEVLALVAEIEHAETIEPAVDPDAGWATAFGPVELVELVEHEADAARCARCPWSMLPTADVCPGRGGSACSEAGGWQDPARGDDAAVAQRRAMFKDLGWSVTE